MSQIDQSELRAEKMIGEDEFLVIEDDSDIILREKDVENRDAHLPTIENNAIPMHPKPTTTVSQPRTFYDANRNASQLFSQNLLNFNNLEKLRSDLSPENLSQSKVSKRDPSLGNLSQSKVGKTSKATGLTKKIQKDPLNTTAHTHNSKLAESDDDSTGCLFNEPTATRNSSKRKISNETSDCVSNLLLKDKVIFKLRKDKRRLKNKVSGLGQEITRLKLEMLDMKRAQAQPSQVPAIEAESATKPNSEIAEIQNPDRDLVYQQVAPAPCITYAKQAFIHLLGLSIILMGPFLGENKYKQEINWPKVMFCILYMVTMYTFLSQDYRKVGLFRKNPNSKENFIKELKGK